MINLSFKTMENLLLNRYVQKNDFMNNLIYHELETVDVYAEDLIDEIKEIVIEECKQNPYYFWREVLKIPYKDKSVDLYELTPRDLFLFWNSLQHINTYTVSMPDKYNWNGIIALLIWEILFNENCPGIVINDRYTNGELLYKKIKTIMGLLPSWLTENISFQDPNASYDEEGNKVPTHKITVKNKEAVVNVTITESQHHCEYCDEDELNKIEDLDIYKDGNLILHTSKYSITKGHIELIRRENEDKISVWLNFEFQPVSVDLLNIYHDNKYAYDIIYSKPNERITHPKHEIMILVANSLKFDYSFYDLSEEEMDEFMLTHSKVPIMYMGFVDGKHYARNGLNRYINQEEVTLHKILANQLEDIYLQQTSIQTMVEDMRLENEKFKKDILDMVTTGNDKRDEIYTRTDNGFIDVNSSLAIALDTTLGNHEELLNKLKSWQDLNTAYLRNIEHYSQTMQNDNVLALSSIIEDMQKLLVNTTPKEDENIPKILSSVNEIKSNLPSNDTVVELLTDIKNKESTNISYNDKLDAIIEGIKNINVSTTVDNTDVLNKLDTLGTILSTMNTLLESIKTNTTPKETATPEPEPIPPGNLDGSEEELTD